MKPFLRVYKTKSNSEHDGHFKFWKALDRNSPAAKRIHDHQWNVVSEIQYVLTKGDISLFEDMGRLLLRSSLSLSREIKPEEIGQKLRNTKYPWTLNILFQGLKILLKLY